METCSFKCPVKWVKTFELEINVVQNKNKHPDWRVRYVVLVLIQRTIGDNVSGSGGPAALGLLIGGFIVVMMLVRPSFTHLFILFWVKNEFCYWCKPDHLQKQIFDLSSRKVLDKISTWLRSSGEIWGQIIHFWHHKFSTTKWKTCCSFFSFFFKLCSRFISDPISLKLLQLWRNAQFFIKAQSKA